ncbi:hypothetical protein J3R83DRAFT_7812 [Lanmaoa asiatica]|nr:hypothetical protein J3R83DRAFT_7812 [Lanmaoa asiatica]
MPATYKAFGDLDCHLPCTAAIMLSQLASIKCNIANITEYFATYKLFQLSKVLHPFYWDWSLAQPSQFLTPKGLHKWHHGFWDHDIH